MKIIHCADLHLDSKLEANLSKEKAKQRKGEILNTFVRMIDYAEKENAEIILIAGDLFDRNNISATASNTVKNAIYSHPGIRFYYLKGNHDSAGIFNNPEDIPENLRLFDDHWTSYHEADGRITISGVELSGSNAGSTVKNWGSNAGSTIKSWGRSIADFFGNAGQSIGKGWNGLVDKVKGKVSALPGVVSFV